MIDEILAIGFGLIFFIGGVSQLRNYLAFRRRSVRVKAVVVDLTGGAGASGKTDYYPVVEFATRDNERVRATSHLGSNPPPARPGQQVKVAYDPDNPGQIDVVKHGWLSFFFAFFVPSLGGLVLALGLVAMIPRFF